MANTNEHSISLHPNHLNDLKKSGLSDETIREAGIYSVRPMDINKKLGFNDPQIRSVMAFPYPGGDGFERFKIFKSNTSSLSFFFDRLANSLFLCLIPINIFLNKFELSFLFNKKLFKNRDFGKSFFSNVQSVYKFLFPVGIRSSFCVKCSSNIFTKIFQ